eukprot:CAMPEP_0113503078 /NCGR_PEP_ID=MMETSP0014_2-20120614/33939_1 /TAXON_ID=2857 /ORGANISM="Nitzschia sp." /LENGTH=85 /DNA_ID=CAMNT_0000397995 /DNA_START=124 /DNA_END=377 /DNA_ORIENTATION=- /assembly_acc=CAM_ASM_000159
MAGGGNKSSTTTATTKTTTTTSLLSNEQLLSPDALQFDFEDYALKQGIPELADPLPYRKAGSVFDPERPGGGGDEEDEDGGEGGG